MVRARSVFTGGSSVLVIGGGVIVEEQKHHTLTSILISAADLPADLKLRSSDCGLARAHLRVGGIN